MTKGYVDSSSENKKNTRDLCLVFYHQDNDIDNYELIKLDSITVNRRPTTDNEFSKKNYVDDNIGIEAVVRFNAKGENYVNV